MTDNRAVMDQEKISDAAQTFHRLQFIRAWRLVTQVAAGGHNGETQFRQEQVVKRI